MATFISRSVEQVLGAALADDHQWFADVDEANVHVATVNGLAAEGIVQGRDVQARRYGPALHVRRDAMASFVGRTLDLLAAEGASRLRRRADEATLATGDAGARIGCGVVRSAPG